MKNFEYLLILNVVIKYFKISTILNHLNYVILVNTWLAYLVVIKVIMLNKSREYCVPSMRTIHYQCGKKTLDF